MGRVIRTFITAVDVLGERISALPQRLPTAAKERWQGHGCLPVPFRPTQRLTAPNGGGIVRGSMTEKKWLLLCQRRIKIQQAAESPWPGSARFLLSDLRPSGRKSGCGRQPAKSVWLPAVSQTLCLPSPAVQVLAAQALSALRGDVVWFFPHFFRPSISPSSAGQIAPGLWHKPVADGNQGNGPAPGTRPPHAPVPLRRGYGAILSPGRHTGAHRGK